MYKIKGKAVDAILKSLDPQKKKIVEKLSSIVNKTLPNAVETVKWGNITYLLKGKNLACILFYKNHIDFGFFMGAKLKSKLLEGTGKSLRHIKIGTQEDIGESEITSLLKGAAKLLK